MFLYNIYIILISTYLVTSTLVDYDGIVTINLQHALIDNIDPVYTDRGNFTIHGLRSAPPYIMQPVNIEDRKRIKELSADNKFYKLKATVLSNDVATASFISTVKACMLAESELNDILSVSLDYAGRIITITLTVASTSTCEGAEVSVEQLKSFTTSVFVRQAETGPIPDTASYIQKIEREKDAKERGEGKDTRSFFEKYWMYIIPVVIVMVLSSAANPEGQAGNGGR